MQLKKVLKIFISKHFAWMALLLLIMNVHAFAQNVPITGTVTEESGKPIVGASVFVKGSTAGTSTDEKGAFQLTGTTKSTLVVSAVGFTTQEINLNGRTTIAITLLVADNTMEDVVVVGYGSKSKKDIGGAVLSVDNKLLKDRPVTNTLSALQGAAPGLVITRTNGQPGRESINAQIRGITSLGTSNAPLVIIDGVEGDINALNPNDIQSISVLEDAASASIYGAKAGGGVILVTTKSGTFNQKAQVAISSLYTFRTPYARPELISSRKQAELQNAARKFANQNPDFTEEQLG